jgi:hypothetical protein
LTIVVLLILVLVWAVVLGPSLLRRGRQRRSDSIGAFHRQLRVLQRTGPTLVDPQHRLDVSLPATHVAHRQGEYRRGLIVVRPDSPAPSASRVPRRPSRRRADPFFRPEACRRRRQVLSALLCLIVLTSLIGAIPAGRPALVLTVITVLATAGYLVLLVQLRNRALERQLKLRYLPEPQSHDLAARRVAAR